jgi:hypothetical protein
LAKEVGESVGESEVLLGCVQEEEAKKGNIMMRHIVFALLAIAMAQPAFAATLRVSQDHKTVQAAIDASNPGDTLIALPSIPA